MALARFTVGTTCTVPAGTPTADANGFGLATWAGATGPPLQWSAGAAACTYPAGTAVVADSSGGSSAACQLYAALQAAGANLQAYRQGTDDVGHAALSN